MFALPFALVGVISRRTSAPVTWAMLGWVVLAFTAARFAAMGFNRIVDREYRRAKSAHAHARASARRDERARGVARRLRSRRRCSSSRRAISTALCLWLSPIALAWVFFYSFTKRFTRLAHLALGLGMSIAPVGGYLAVTGRWSHPWWLLCVLATAVVTWGAGFDVLYALPDIAFDRDARPALDSGGARGARRDRRRRADCT